MDCVSWVDRMSKVLWPKLYLMELEGFFFPHFFLAPFAKDVFSKKKKKIMNTRVPSWLSRLRIQHCYSYGMGSILG